MRKHGLRLRAVGCGGAAILLAALAAACTTDSVMAVRPDVDVGFQTAAVVVPPAPVAVPEPELPVPEEVGVQAAPAGRGMQALVPSDPYLAAYPQPDNPLPMPEEPVEVEPAEPVLRMSADEIDCRRDLKRLGVKYQDLPPINQGGSCRIDFPVKVTAIGSVKMKPAATLSCAMAATFSRWTKSELVPAARWRFMSGVDTIHQGSSYSCRNIRGSRGTPSQHSVGNALDVMRIELNNGKDIDVRKKGWFAFRQRGFLNTVRADGCGYFTTVLGPGYNADHADHFHFDLMKRRNGRVACK